MIIGITGTIYSGKGTLVDALKEEGFAHFSVRGFLEEELDRRKLERDRDNLVAVANELREKYGPQYIAEQLYKKVLANEMLRNRKAIIESLRNTSEIDFLRKHAGQDFYLIALDAPPEMRYNRSHKRGDKLSHDEFIQKDQREMASDDPNKQNIGACMGDADYFFWSEYYSSEDSEEGAAYGNAEIAKKEFTSGKAGFLNLFGDNPRRPTFDEAYMRQAWEWSQRSTCLRRKTGAVIVMDKTQISQGYNGAPRGVIHCAERGGCERQKRNIVSGSNLELCYAAHAEANAIWNAGRSGRSIIGATMYATNEPCRDCATGIVQSGIKKVIYLGDYHSELKILEEAGVEMQKYRQGIHPKTFSRIWG